MNNCTLRKHLYDAPAAPHAQYIQPISSHWPHFTEMASEWFLLSAFTQASLKKLQWFCCLTLTELWGKLFLGGKKLQEPFLHFYLLIIHPGGDSDDIS